MLASAGCATKSGTGAAVGAGTGGVIGGLVGGTSGALIGVGLGALLGYGVGRAIEEEDRRRMVYALEQNQPAYWTNPNNGNSYRVEPTGTRMEQGQPCREFRMFAEVDGQPQEVNGTACRRPDGNWEILSG
jgi:surface antigen